MSRCLHIPFGEGETSLTLYLNNLKVKHEVFGTRWEIRFRVCGERLKIFVNEKQSQDDVEKRTGWLRYYISRVKNGHTVPSIQNLRKWRVAWKFRCTESSSIMNAYREKLKIPSQDTPRIAVNTSQDRELRSLTTLFS